MKFKLSLLFEIMLLIFFRFHREKENKSNKQINEINIKRHNFKSIFLFNILT